MEHDWSTWHEWSARHEIMGVQDSTGERRVGARCVGKAHVELPREHLELSGVDLHQVDHLTQRTLLPGRG